MIIFVDENLKFSYHVMQQTVLNCDAVPSFGLYELKAFVYLDESNRENIGK